MDIKSYALGSLISIYFFEFQKCLSIFAKHSPSHRNYHTRKKGNPSSMGAMRHIACACLHWWLGVVALDGVQSRCTLFLLYNEPWKGISESFRLPSVRGATTINHQRMMRECCWWGTQRYVFSSLLYPILKRRRCYEPDIVDIDVHRLCSGVVWWQKEGQIMLIIMFLAYLDDLLARRKWSLLG